MKKPCNSTILGSTSDALKSKVIPKGLLLNLLIVPIFSALYFKEPALEVYVIKVAGDLDKRYLQLCTYAKLFRSECVGIYGVQSGSLDGV